MSPTGYVPVIQDNIPTFPTFPAFRGSAVSCLPKSSVHCQWHPEVVEGVAVLQTKPRHHSNKWNLYQSMITIHTYPYHLYSKHIAAQVMFFSVADRWDFWIPWHLRYEQCTAHSAPVPCKFLEMTFHRRRWCKWHSCGCQLWVICSRAYTCISGIKHANTRRFPT